MHIKLLVISAENKGKNHDYETVSVIEIDISCLLKEPVCHLLASDLRELVFVLQTFNFRRGKIEHQPYISPLKCGICLQVFSSPLQVTVAVTARTLGEHHGYTPCYSRIRPSTH